MRPVGKGRSVLTRSMGQRANIVTIVATLPMLAAGCSGGDEDSVAPSTTLVPAAPPSFAMVELVADANGPAGVLPIDLDGDGRLELVVNEFGDRPDDAGPTEFPPGGLSIYWREGDGPVGDEATSWRREVIFDHEAGAFFPNDITAADLDDDGGGDLDVGSAPTMSTA